MHILGLLYYNNYIHDFYDSHIQLGGCIWTALVRSELFMQTQYCSSDIADNNSIWMHCWLNALLLEEVHANKQTQTESLGIFSAF